MHSWDLAMGATNTYECMGFGAKDATNRFYAFMCFGAMKAIKPYGCMGIAALDATNASEFMGCGAMEATKFHDSIGAGAMWPPSPLHLWALGPCMPSCHMNL